MSSRSRRTWGAGVMAGAAARLTSRLRGDFVSILRWVGDGGGFEDLLDVFNGVGGDEAGRGEEGKLEEMHVDVVLSC